MIIQVARLGIEPSVPALIGLLRNELSAASGVDFSYYKKSTIKRRVARRMALHNIETLSEYLEHLEVNRQELDTLYQDILIHVTSFFREPDVFLALQRKILPHIVAGKSGSEALRIWVPGCSTGEEVYSIAISLLENLGGQASAMPIQIFGTDISEKSIEYARAGIYPESVLQDVSKERLRRFFSRSNEHHYRVSTAIREVCIFARHDMTRDPPFSTLDLISCRNVLIYLEPMLQKRVLTLFHYALKDKGYLLLGRSETLGRFPELFAMMDKKNKLFTKKAMAEGAGDALGLGTYEKFRRIIISPSALVRNYPGLLGKSDPLRCAEWVFRATRGTKHPAEQLQGRRCKKKACTPAAWMTMPTPLGARATACSRGGQLYLSRGGQLLVSAEVSPMRRSSSVASGRPSRPRNAPRGRLFCWASYRTPQRWRMVGSSPERGFRRVPARSSRSTVSGKSRRSPLPRV